MILRTKVKARMIQHSAAEKACPRRAALSVVQLHIIGLYGKISIETAHSRELNLRLTDEKHVTCSQLSDESVFKETFIKYLFIFSTGERHMCFTVSL